MSPEDIAASALANLNGDKKSPTAGKKKKTARRSNKKTIQYPVEPTVIQSVSKGRGYMNHSYRDFSKVPPAVDYVPATKIEDMGFAEKIHHILGQEEYAKYISWMPHGRAFKVTVPVVFERLVCPKYFGHKRYSSFLRQLNNHGFKHISTGTDRNCYYHEVRYSSCADRSSFEEIHTFSLLFSYHLPFTLLFFLKLSVHA